MKSNRLATIYGIKNLSNNIIEVTLKAPNNFNFVAGQYITLFLADLKDMAFRDQFRDFSISSPPEQAPIIKVTYRQSNSLFKQTLSAMPIGSKLEIDGPAGNFTLPLDNRPLVLIAGGIGITPFISMLQSNQTYGLVTILHFNRITKTESQFSFLSDLPLVTYASYLERPTTKLLRPHINNLQNQQWYIAGPPAMVNKVRKYLQILGINLAQIKSEEFSGYEELD